MVRATVVATAPPTAKRMVLAKIPGPDTGVPVTVRGSAGPAPPLCGRAIDQEIV